MQTSPGLTSGVATGTNYFTSGYLRLYLGALLALQIFTLAQLMPFALQGKTDFRTFYTAGHMIHSGQLYDYNAETAAQSVWVSPNRFALPFMFPPFAALPFGLFARLSFRTAYFYFFLLNIACCLIASWRMRSLCPELDSRWKPLLPMLFLSFAPLGTALVFGQVSIILLLIYCASFALLQQDSPFLSGLCLSLAMIKFQTALPLVLLFLLWRQWRFLFGVLAGSAALALISLRMIGAHALFAYVQSLARMSSQTSNETRFGMFSAQMPSLYGLFHSFVPGTAAFPLTALSSILVLGWAATRRPSFPLALLAGLLVSFHLYAYDLTLLLLPLSLLLNAALKGPLNRIALGAAAFFLALPALDGFIPVGQQHLIAIPLAFLFLSFPAAAGAINHRLTVQAQNP